jgi:hypothetical protein
MKKEKIAEKCAFYAKTDPMFLVILHDPTLNWAQTLICLKSYFTDISISVSEIEEFYIGFMNSGFKINSPFFLAGRKIFLGE